jgi:cytochrome c553
MDYYRSGARTNQVMISIAKSLDAEQVAALAAYYGTLPKAKAKK